MGGLFGIVILFALVIGIGSLVYIIKSLIDMWKEYAATKNETILLLFILNIIGFFLSGALISMIVAIIFYWNRSNSTRPRRCVREKERWSPNGCPSSCESRREAFKRTRKFLK
jgi:uncharacterized BrkB/YihY/UPF0761 family membrane protein